MRSHYWVIWEKRNAWPVCLLGGLWVVRCFWGDLSVLVIGAEEAHPSPTFSPAASLPLAASSSSCYSSPEVQRPEMEVFVVPFLSLLSQLFAMSPRSVDCSSNCVQFHSLSTTLFFEEITETSRHPTALQFGVEVHGMARVNRGSQPSRPPTRGSAKHL